MSSCLVVCRFNETMSLFYAEFGSKRFQISQFGSRYPLQMWEKPETAWWLSRAVRNNSSRPTEKDKYTSNTYMHTVCECCMSKCTELLIEAVFSAHGAVV